MAYSNLSYRCYILPIIGAITYILLSLPIINTIFTDWIPDYTYQIVIKALIILVVLFLTCRCLDIIWCNMCHDGICTDSLKNMCTDLLNLSVTPLHPPHIADDISNQEILPPETLLPSEILPPEILPSQEILPPEKISEEILPPEEREKGLSEK